jgi:hypothetical protein
MDAPRIWQSRDQTTAGKNFIVHMWSDDQHFSVESMHCADYQRSLER